MELKQQYVGNSGHENKWKAIIIIIITTKAIRTQYHNGIKTTIYSPARNADRQHERLIKSGSSLMLTVQAAGM